MNTIKSIAILILTFIFIFGGCSDRFQLPNEPETGAYINSLEKINITNFTAIETFNRILNPGIMKIVDQNIIVKGSILESSFESSNDLIKGSIIVTGNGRLNLNTGEGPVHGIFTLTPNDVAGGIWKGDWKGYRKMTGNMEWTTNAHLVAHGEGGDMEGMMFYADEEIISNLPSGGPYTGETSGYIKSK